jgi:hypothetical protein
VALADHPRGTDDVVPRHRYHDLVASRFRVSVYTERNYRIVFALGALRGAT